MTYWKMYVDGKLNPFPVYDVAMPSTMLQLYELIYLPKHSYIFVKEGAPDLEIS